MNQPLQPLLHDSTVLLRAPSQAWCARDGDMGTRAIHGFYHSDVRIIDLLELTVGGDAPECIAHTLEDSSTATYVSLVRSIDTDGADPRVRLDRRRTVTAHGLREELQLTNALDRELSTDVAVRLRVDCTPMQSIKAGLADRQPVRMRRAGADLRVASGTVTATLSAPDAALECDEPAVTLRWSVTVPSGSSATVSWELTAADGASVVRGASAPPEWRDVHVRSDDIRLSAWVEHALGDLTALRMTTNDAPDEPFLAAGAPWFFTLFGRDSLWAARLLLPLGTGLAASTLRVLAGMQGTRCDEETAEQPGKIMHELRSGTLTIPGENVSLPPLYYGTVDATALWACLLHDAWRWGMPHDEVQALLPNLEAALAWMRDYGDSDGDGFLEYADTSGHGLANQGWKDSGDSIQWRDGSLAEGPIALCEVQGYAYDAAIGGAELLDHFGRPGGDGWRQWASALKDRFADAFWIDDTRGPYPAVALDASKRPVDTVTSNMGHLLGTGILTSEQSVLVARRLVSPELDSGYGLRTMSTDAAGYWPLSYHGGSVWAHDTAIAITGLAHDGFVEEAATLSRGLLAAAAGFGYRMPELHSGDARRNTRAPVPYPAACRPQAWSAASAVAVLSARLGLHLGAHGVTAAPAPGAGAIEVTGLRFSGRPFDLRADAAGAVAYIRPPARSR